MICRKATGPPDRFAARINICRSALMQTIKEMKELGAPIAYCKQRQSYYYQDDKHLFIGFINKE